MSPIRPDVSRLDLVSAAAARLDATARGGGPEAFSDFSAFAADATVRLGAESASLDPGHAARTVVGFIAEG